MILLVEVVCVLYTYFLIFSFSLVFFLFFSLSLSFASASRILSFHHLVFFICLGFPFSSSSLRARQTAFTSLDTLHTKGTFPFLSQQQRETFNTLRELATAPPPSNTLPSSSITLYVFYFLSYNHLSFFEITCLPSRRTFLDKLVDKHSPLHSLHFLSSQLL